MKNKIYICLLVIVCSALSMSNLAFAQGQQIDTTSGRSGGQQIDTTSPKVETLDNPLTVNSVGDLIKSGVQVFSYIAILIAVVMFVIVGLKYIFAMGNPEKMKEASRWLLYIVIGVAVVIGANLAVTIVINTLSATGAVDPKVIQSAKDALK